MQAVIVFIVLVSIFARGAVAQTVGRIWRVEPGLEQWTAESVAIGSGQVFAAHSLGYSRQDVLSSANGAGLAQTSAPGMTWHYRTAAGAWVFDADVPGTSSMQQRVYVRTPAWTWQFPELVSNSDRIAVAVSRDGQRISAASNSTLVAFDSGIPTTIPLGFLVLALDVSADGSALLVTGDSAVRVYSLPDLSVLYEATGGAFNFHSAAISGDGARFAVGRAGRADVFQRNGSSYAPAFSHAVQGTNYCDRLDVSDDGSTLVAAFDFFDTNRRVLVDVVNLDTGALLNELDSFTVSTTNFAGGVSLSADGSIVAVGLWGDGAGPESELVFLRRGEPAPLASYSLPSSVLDLELSENGALCVVGTKDVHATAPNNRGSVELYRVLPGRRRG